MHVKRDELAAWVLRLGGELRAMRADPDRLGAFLQEGERITARVLASLPLGSTHVLLEIEDEKISTRRLLDVTYRSLNPGTRVEAHCERRDGRLVDVLDRVGPTPAP